MKKLQCDFINPVFFRRLPAQGIVTQGRVLVGDQVLTFAAHEDAYPDGTPVYVWCGDRYFHCETLTEREQARLALEAAHAAREAQRLSREAQQQQAIQAFNAALHIPVAWFPEIKHRLGGLTERSAGNGWCKNSVVHVYLLEALQAGRLRRAAHDFLCTSQEGQHFGELISLEAAAFNRQHLQVTCSQCLTMAARWRNP